MYKHREVSDDCGWLMRSDAICMFMPGSIQEKGINSCPIFAIFQTSFGRQMENLCGATICLMPAGGPESIKKNVTFLKHTFIIFLVKLYFSFSKEGCQLIIFL